MPATETVISSGREIRLPIGGFQKRGMTCFQIDPLLDSRWRALVDEHPDASVFHRVEWLQALHSCYGYVPVAVSYGLPGGPLHNGLVYCEIRSRLTGNRLVSLPFSDHCEPLLSNR